MASLDPQIVDDVKARYLSGQDLPTIAATLAIPRFLVYTILDDPAVKAATLARVTSLQNRIVDFKLRAFDAAEDALAKLAFLGQNAADESLQRKASNDVIRIAGLEPRKIVRVMGHMDHSLDAESRQWFDEVLQEVGMRKIDVVDAEPGSITDGDGDGDGDGDESGPTSSP